jgi:hypothetical protein
MPIYSLKSLFIILKLLKFSFYLFIILAISVVALWFKPQISFQHDSARHLPWKLPDYKQAKTSVNILSDGRIKIVIEHLPLNNITPEMLSWFYQQLPISTIEFRSTSPTSPSLKLPLYHIFHPSEHGVIRVVEKAIDGSKGMGVGALVSRQEWFGPYNSKGAGRIMAFSKEGMLISPEVAGFHFGTIKHSFIQTKTGTQYNMSSIIGSDAPIIGPAINFYLRHKMFSPPMIKQWLRHQVQEVSSLPFFLPTLYHTKGVNSHYILDLPTANDMQK